MLYRPADRVLRKRSARPFVHPTSSKNPFVPTGSRDGGYHLVVKIPFAEYNIGDPITDPAAIAQVMADHQRRFVVKIPDDAEAWQWHPAVQAAKPQSTKAPT